MHKENMFFAIINRVTRGEKKNFIADATFSCANNVFNENKRDYSTVADLNMGRS